MELTRRNPPQGSRAYPSRLGLALAGVLLGLACFSPVAVGAVSRLGLIDAIFSRRMDIEAARRKSATPSAADTPNATDYNRGGSGSYASTFMPEWDHERALRDGYKACSWVYACIDRIAGGAATVPWAVLRKHGEEWDREDGHPHELAIEWPNDFMTREFLKEAELCHLGIGGNSLVKLVTKNGLVTEGGIVTDLFPLNPALYRPKLPAADDRSGDWIKGYENLTTSNPRDRFYRPEEVVHAMRLDPANLIWGIPPMRSVAAVVDMDVKQVRWNAALPDNAMVPSLFISDPRIASAEQAGHLEDVLAEKYMSPERSRRPMAAGADVKVTRLSMTPEEMDWMESRRFSLLEICAVYGVHAALFDPREQPRANAETAVRYTWENGIPRFLGILEGAYNLRLVPRKERATTWIHYDLSQIPALQDTLPERLKAYETAVRNFIPPNRAMVLVGLPSQPLDPEVGDKSWMPGALVPAESTPPDTGTEPGGVAGVLPGEGDSANGGDVADSGDTPGQITAAAHRQERRRELRREGRPTGDTYGQ